MSLITIYLIFLYVMAAIYLILFVLQIFKKNSLSMIFAAFSLVSAVYLFGVAGQIISDSYMEIIFYQKLKYMGVPYVAPVFFLFLYRFKNYKLPPGRIIVLTLLLPIIITFLVNTNETHWLYYDSSSIVNYNGYTLLVTTRGPLYYLSFYNYIMFGFIIYYAVLLIRQKNSNNNVFLITIIIGLVSTIILNILYYLRIVPLGIDLVPLTTIIQLFSFYIAMFKLKIFDIYEAEMEIVPKLSEGIIFVDDENVLVHYNPASEKIFDFLSPKLIGKRLDKIEEATPLFSNINNEYIIKVNDKRYKVSLSNIYGKIFIINDYTKQHETERKLKWMAEHDGLTGVYNQVHALKVLEHHYNKSMKLNEEFNILMIDINNFKDLNDKYGHIVGNEVLVQLGSVIIKTLGENKNIMFGRFGGDEFIISFYKISNNDCFKLTRKLIDEINKIKIDGFQEIKINVSAGLANRIDSCKTESCTYIDLVEKADLAMYESKRQGDNIITSYKL